MASKVKNTMLGRTYTFFLNCRDLSSAWYLYQIDSTGISESFFPMMTLKKIGEKTGPRDFQVRDGKKRTNMFSSDIIATILGSRDKIEKTSVEFFRKQIVGGLEGSYNPYLKKYPPDIEDPKDQEMPSWEIVPGSENYLTKLIIIELRDKLRWNRYRFFPGNYIDILVSPTKFGVLEIMGDREHIWLEPRGLYSNLDPNMTNPLKGTFMYPQNKFEGENKASDLNRAIRKTEWRSFSISEKE